MKKTGMKKILKPMLIAAAVLLLTGIFAVPAAAEEAKDVEDYTYSVTPMVKPFGYLFYVKTDNPDPASFRFCDKSNKYASNPEDTTSLMNSEGISLLTSDFGDGNYMDVVYENAEMHRVKGGYIFRGRSDGGTLMLQKKEEYIEPYNGIYYREYRWTDTGITVSCTALKDAADYLLDTYTNAGMSFFEKLDAVQAGLNQIALYPLSLRNMSKPNTATPYPFLTTSPYPELGLNQHYEMYEWASYMTSCAYPFVLDSLGFPGMMAGVASRLDSSAVIESGYAHYSIAISLGGETKYYGGAGSGNSSWELKSTQLKKNYKFDGSSGDLGLKGTLAKVRNQFVEYQGYGQVNLDEMRAEMHFEKIRETPTLGTWIRVGREPYWVGSPPPQEFAYAIVVPGYDEEYISYASDCWVDGRYVGIHESLEVKETFADHPTADIIVRGLRYTDINGVVHKRDVRFPYYSDTNDWRAKEFYAGRNWYSSNEVSNLPDELVITQAEAAAMRPDRNTATVPDSGLVYDSRSPAGSPFTTKHLQSITGSTDRLDVYVNAASSASLEFTMAPADADFRGYAVLGDYDSESLYISKGYTDADGVGQVSISALKPGAYHLVLNPADGDFSFPFTVYAVVEPVTNLKVTRKSTAATVSWSPAGTVTGYVVEKKVNGSWTRVKKITDKNIISVTDSNSADTVYRVKSYVTMESGTYSSAYIMSALNAPVLSGTKEAASVSLSWTKTDGASAYQIYRKPKGGSYSLLKTVTGTKYTDTKLTAGETYVYRVRAKSGTTFSAYSNTLSFLHNPFTDVPESASYFSSVMWAARNGITGGTSATAFSPEKQCTRYQFAVMLYKLAGKPEIGNVTLPFTDVPSDASYYKAVAWARKKGIISGTSASTFSPNDPVTRYQVVQMLYKFAGKPAVNTTVNPFTDVNETSSYCNAVLWAVENGITKGTSASKFSPNAECLRYQMAVFLNKYNNIYHLK